MSNENNSANIPSNLDHAPATKVGGMRVKAPDARRTSLKDESKEEEKEEDLSEEDKEEQERLRILELKERQAQDMQSHTASRQPDVTKNAGSNVKQINNPTTQPRAMNH